MRTLLAIFIICVALVGCTSTRTVRSQADIASLPRSQGVYGGSWLIHTWTYEGSDPQFDHFVYTYTHDNFARRVPVRMVRGLVTLGFQSRPFRLPDDGVPVTPDYRDDRVIGFTADRDRASEPVSLGPDSPPLR